jgi:hypothetical protein
VVEEDPSRKQRNAAMISGAIHPASNSEIVARSRRWNGARAYVLLIKRIYILSSAHMEIGIMYQDNIFLWAD